MRREEIPVVMHRKNNGKWRVTMSLEDFVTIYREWENNLTIKETES